MAKITWISIFLCLLAATSFAIFLVFIFIQGVPECPKESSSFWAPGVPVALNANVMSLCPDFICAPKANPKAFQFTRSSLHAIRKATVWYEISIEVKNPCEGVLLQNNIPQEGTRYFGDFCNSAYQRSIFGKIREECTFREKNEKGSMCWNASLAATRGVPPLDPFTDMIIGMSLNAPPLNPNAHGVSGETIVKANFGKWHISILVAIGELANEWSAFFSNLANGTVGPEYGRLFTSESPCGNASECPTQYWIVDKSCRFSTGDGTEEGDITTMLFNVEVPLIDSALVVYKVAPNSTESETVHPDAVCLAVDYENIQLAVNDKANNCTVLLGEGNLSTVTSDGRLVPGAIERVGNGCAKQLPMTECSKVRLTRFMQ